MSVTISMKDASFVFDKDRKPVSKIQSGEIVVFETEDANVGCIRKESDIYSNFPDLLKDGGGCNPVTGPIEIEGALPGDNLAVEILDIKPGYFLGEGYTALFPGLGMLQTDMYGLQTALDSRTKICKLDDRYVYFKLRGNRGTVRIPLEPMVGTIGVAPSVERVASSALGKEFAGNMDLRDVKAGSTVYLQVNVPGGLLSLGDVHACQGDGEITGCALECQGLVKVRVTLVPKEKAKVINWPIIESEEYIGVAVPLGQNDQTAAIKAGYAELCKWMETFYRMDLLDAYQLLNLAGEVRMGSEYSVECRISKKILSTI